MRKVFIAIAVCLLSTALYAAKPLTDGPLPPADDYTVLTGKVTIGTVGDRTVGVMVDQGDSYRHLFRLWTSGPVKPFRATSQNASIEYRGDELVIMAADQDLFWVLATSTGDARAPRQPVGFTATRYVGYGLNHEIRPLAVHQRSGNRRTIVALTCDDFDSCIFNEDFGIGGGVSGGACDSGGVGSSSCSTSNNYGSCSVSCTTGYACCTNASGPNAGASCRCKGN
jgi:hypothetical protein